MTKNKNICINKIFKKKNKKIIYTIINDIY